MCESGFGHNVGVNLCFSERFVAAGFSTRIYACEKLPLSASEADLFRRVLPSVLTGFGGVERTVARIASFLNGLEEDLLFFPNVDRYTLKALAQSGNALHGKRISLRMIAVGECLWHGEDQRYIDGYSPNRFDHFDDLRQIASLCDVFISAESSAYQRLIGDRTGLACGRWPIPMRNAERVPSTHPRDVVYLPGTPRWDKGSAVADALTSAMAKANPALTFAFQTDGTETIQQGNRVLLPRLLEREVYQNWLQRSLCVVLPYDREVYRYRGSASVFDAADAGAAIFTLDGLGFSDEVVESGIGRVYNDIESLMMLDVQHACSAVQPVHFEAFNEKRRVAFEEQIAFLRGQ